MARTRPLPYLFLISGTHSSNSNLRIRRAFLVTRSGPILSNLRAIRQALPNNKTAWHGPCIACTLPGAPTAAPKEPFMSTEIHPVDQILPAPRLLALGLQHVLVMYAGAVAA